MTRRKYIILGFFALAALGAWYWLSDGKPNPREWALGAWKEQTSRLFVEVTPEGTLAVRGLGRAAVKYEWVQTEEEPYLMRCTYRGHGFEALISFSGKDTAIVEPQIWDLLPSDMQRQITKENRRHNRPEHELRMLFHRRPIRQKD